MQDTQTDWHIMLVASLVLVAASAIFQTVVGLDADKLSAAQSQRMFATVVAASGPTTNPKVERFTKQFRTIEVVDNGHARIRGIVSSVTSRGVMVGTWGGEWKVIISAATKFAGQKGKFDPANIKEGDYVFAEGIAENTGAPVISAQSFVDYTAYRIPSGPETQAGRDDRQTLDTPSQPVPPTSATNTPRTLPPQPGATIVPAAPNPAVGVPGIHEPKSIGEPRKVPLQKSLDR